MRKLRHEEIRRPDPAEAALLPKHPISVVVDSVRSIYNVGSIFRTSDAARVEHVYLTGISGTPDHPSVHKTALGAQDSVAWSYDDNPVDVVRNLKRSGYVVGILEITDEPSATTNVSRDTYPLCLVLGNELHGVDEAIVELADVAFEIPQYGAKQSLNVAVAYGIAVFDLVRRFRELEGMDAMPTSHDAEAIPTAHDTWAMPTTHDVAKEVAPSNEDQDELSGRHTADAKPMNVSHSTEQVDADSQ